MHTHVTTQCATGKRGYRSAHAAKRAHACAAFRFRVYICPHCRLWHASNGEKK